MTSLADVHASPSSSPQKLIRRDEAEIRARLLRTLGIFFQVEDVSSEVVSTKSTGRSSCFKHKDEEEKKMDHNDYYDYYPVSPSSGQDMRVISTSVLHLEPMPSLLDFSTMHQELLLISSKRSRRKKKIQFLPYVTVVDIPSHRDYPQNVQEQLWTSLDEIQANGWRNSLEFEADNRDWRKATEEDVFIGVNGELVHPETYRQHCRSHRRQRGPGANKKKNRKKKKKGNIPKKHLGRINALRARLRGSKNGHSLTRFADS
ncbi:expressed unknown protein [Seminavis robusta]|uniref:Uncharacterized protein n=1 Tax=Seminavis robusta TaxID=568900 RepID=A0A9N8E463_9STRA|nr:expressed unknown protein [Seminavis robusta]|eukprot:Sro483_g152140.1 n/a (260) ;mRNA; f:56723-57502